MKHTIKKKVKKRKINLIIPNYNNLNYNLILLKKNNDCNILIPNI